MSKITEMRERLASAVAELPGDTNVVLAPTDYAAGGETMFIIEKHIGENTPENQAIVDDMFDTVPDAFKLDPELGNIVFVSKCSGHRLYGTFPGAPVKVGCEWTVKVLM